MLRRLENEEGVVYFEKVNTIKSIFEKNTLLFGSVKESRRMSVHLMVRFLELLLHDMLYHQALFIIPSQRSGFISIVDARTFRKGLLRRDDPKNFSEMGLLDKQCIFYTSRGRRRLLRYCSTQVKFDDPSVLEKTDLRINKSQPCYAKGIGELRYRGSVPNVPKLSTHQA